MSFSQDLQQGSGSLLSSIDATMPILHSSIGIGSSLQEEIHNDQVAIFASISQGCIFSGGWIKVVEVIFVLSLWSNS